MSKFYQSIRWRMQLWHGLLLLVVLVAFGVTACWFVRHEQMNRVDQELRRRLVLLTVGGGPRGGPGGRPQGMGGAQSGAEVSPEAGPGRGPNRGPVFRLPQGQRGLFEESERGSYYYVIWDAEGEVTGRSETAPEDVPPPDSRFLPELSFPRIRMLAGDSPSEERGGEPPPEDRGRFSLPRVRGLLHERLALAPNGERAVVGHSLEPENAELRRLAMLFAIAGGGVLVLGLVVGGWLSGRSIRPIAEISSTAKKIASGNLSERINAADTESELGELAKVLNETFERLQSAIARQAQFTADASHELRTPAFVILSEAQSALKRERTTAEYREGFEVCQRAAQQMRQLIESLLVLARQDAGEAALKREPARLDAMADDVLEMLRPLAREKGVDLRAELAAIQVACDVQQLRQVLTNLVSNAIEYNRPNGVVRVKLSQAGREVLLTVTDTGVGIAADDLPHIFERFYRADKSRSTSEGHTGLGLAICDAIVKAHSGRIEADSELGKGSTFVVHLPA